MEVLFDIPDGFTTGNLDGNADDFADGEFVDVEDFAGTTDDFTDVEIVGLDVGDFVGLDVGDFVGLDVGDFVGGAVNNVVDFTNEEIVGIDVGDFVSTADCFSVEGVVDDDNGLAGVESFVQVSQQLSLTVLIAQYFACFFSP